MSQPLAPQFIRACYPIRNHTGLLETAQEHDRLHMASCQQRIQPVVPRFEEKRLSRLCRRLSRLLADVL